MFAVVSINLIKIRNFIIRAGIRLSWQDARGHIVICGEENKFEVKPVEKV